MAKGRDKRGIKFTIMLCGESGTGKTTFINSLLDQNIMPHKYSSSSEELPKTLTFSNINGSDNTLDRQFHPTLSHHEPGISITETNVEIIDEDDDSKLLLSIIDTPGFGENLDNEICFKEICEYLEQQFDSVLAEETRVKRNPRFEDPRIHVMLYFITPTGHGLRELDITAMKKLSKYCNVLPIIGRADSFTESELKNFKKHILYDIEKFNIPTFQFSYDEEADDQETIEENKFLSSLQPFAVITSEQIIQDLNGEKKRVRTYPWGSIDIADLKNSDFPFVKNVLLGSHLQELKELTHDYLYETYRTEKLSQFSGLSPNPNDEYTPPPVHQEREPPSLSNLAELVNGSTPTTPVQPKKKKSMLLDEDEDDMDQQSYTTSVRETLTPRPDPITKDSVPGTPRSTITTSSSIMYSPDPNFQPDKAQLRKISETIPYLLDQRNQILKQKKLEEKEEKTAKIFANRAAELERKAMELKARQKQLEELLKLRRPADAGVGIKKEETLTDLHSIVSKN